MTQLPDSVTPDILSAFFINASMSTIAKLTELNIPLTTPQPVTTVDEVSGNEWSASVRNVHLNTLSIRDYIYRAAPLLNHAAVKAAWQCAEMLARHQGARLPFWSPFPPNNRPLVDQGYLDEVPAAHENDHVRWTLENVVLPALRHHLEALPHLGNSRESAYKFAHDVIEFVCSETVRRKISVPVAGLDVSEPYCLEQGDETVIIRPLKLVEIGAIIDRWGRNFFLAGYSIPTATIEIIVTSPKDKAGVPDSTAINYWVTALRLHGHRVFVGPPVISGMPGWVFPVAAGPNGLSLLRRHALNVDDSRKLDFNAVNETCRKVGKYKIDVPGSSADLAIHRFSTGLERENHADALLDFVISLEAALLPYDEFARHGDLGYRFRIHGAHYIAANSVERHAILKTLTNLYGVRSKLVHGGKYPGGEEIRTARESAEDIARKVLLKAVENGFPSASDFRDMLLGTTDPQAET